MTPIVVTVREEGRLRSVRVNPDHITDYSGDLAGSTVELSTGRSLFIREAPDQLDRILTAKAPA